jgi:VWFA-related protein
MLLACSGGGGDDAPPPAPTPNISLARSINFEGSLLGSGSGQTFVLTNIGNANLTIGQISKPSLPFSIPNVSDFCSNKTLSPSQTCALTVLFSPTAQGSVTGNFTIPSNDPDSSNVNISLSGEGYGLNVWINEIEVSTADCISFVARVTVTDPVTPTNDVALRALTESNFTLNGGLLTITSSPSNLYPSPISLVLALDSSESLNGISPTIKVAAKSLISQLDPDDEAAICKFYSVIDFHPAAAPLFKATDAAGIADLNAYIEETFSGSKTPLYDAIMQSVDRAVQGTTGKRKVVVVLSDGVDFTSVITKTVDEVIAYAVLKGIPIFTIYDVDPSYGGGSYGNTQVMQRLARETGGQYYYSDTADLTSVFQQISSILSNTYTINYTSPAPMCSGTLDVRADWTTLYGQDSRSFSYP